MSDKKDQIELRPIEAERAEFYYGCPVNSGFIAPYSPPEVTTWKDPTAAILGRVSLEVCFSRAAMKEPVNESSTLTVEVHDHKERKGTRYIGVPVQKLTEWAVRVDLYQAKLADPIPYQPKAKE